MNRAQTQSQDRYALSLHQHWCLVGHHGIIEGTLRATYTQIRELIRDRQASGHALPQEHPMMVGEATARFQSVYRLGATRSLGQMARQEAA